MKRTVLSLMGMITLLSVSTSDAVGQIAANVYEVPNVDEIVAKHQTIAILPLDVVMTDAKSNKKNRATPEELEEQELEYQTSFQNSMYAWFLKRKRKGKMIDVAIQDVERTNLLLRKAGIESNEGLADYTKEEIAAILGVDAVFGGNVKTTATFSQGGAVALAIIAGVSVKTGDADVFIKLWNGADGEMIWSYSRTVSSSYSNTTDDMVDYLMKRVSKRFPYEK